MPDKKVVLVTGGAGFIGSHLCEMLLKEGNRIVCVDNFSTGHVRNIDPYLRNPDFQFLRLDINEPFDVEAFPELEPFKIPFTGLHEVYHLATPTSIKNFDDYRAQTLLTNSIGTRNALEIAVKYKAKFLLTSSSVVYGGRTEERSVFKEDDEGIVHHLTPRACYDEGKRFAETMVDTYRQVYGIETRIARIFRTYGPRMALFDGHQIPDFILSALNNEPLMINGDKDFRTSLVYVKDICDGLIRMMAAKNIETPLNLGSDIDIPIVEVANKIIKISGSKSEVAFGESLKFLTELGVPNIEAAKEQLGWLPVVRLEDGLTKTVEYIRANKILLTNE